MLGVQGARVAVLRVPILYVSILDFLHRPAALKSAHVRRTRRYGPPLNADSAVNILLGIVQDQSGKQYRMDHYQTRFPTNALDIASFLVRLARKEKLHFVRLLFFTSAAGWFREARRGRTAAPGDPLLS